MLIHISEDSDLMGRAAALYCEKIMRETLKANGRARILLSTGASQFDFFTHFVKAELEWDKVEMFHLDEYVQLSEDHPASFRKYLKERFLQPTGVHKYWLVDGEKDVHEKLQRLNEEIAKYPVDLALIGIGENAHIAFNDPPADFHTKEPYKIVDLDDACKQQQVREGWFKSIDEVPKQAITMTVHQILQSKQIVSCVPHQVKAKAIRQTLQSSVTPEVPSTILKTHPHWRLYLDKESSAEMIAWP
ncbi:glucosamine-6-phosphate deaminase [Paenibacillus sp. J2TS4]|uniref:glucosamine-6-phosphate deaminase n=1 Tax=Paenibacillus sp. J2TS4 TaxID=2807194 RepID=UPI001AFF4F23|nr:glucosamine-6-phosphate deaminase [Paenibacillus sp. J2TS4]GIP34700.1 glucosamine-6-phosphate deaminase [Paenibacillus sp. J2TS4]